MPCGGVGVMVQSTSLGPENDDDPVSNTLDGPAEHCGPLKYTIVWGWSYCVEDHCGPSTV